MKRTFAGLVILVASLSLSSASNAQLGGGMSFFKKPSIADIFHPVVGAGSTYEETNKDGSKTALEMSVISREDVDGKESYWFEVGHNDKRSGDAMTYAKILVSKDDFEMHKMIFVMPGSNTPMEMPINQTAKTKERMAESMDKWHKVGTESVTVPAGTFLCDHWAKDDGTEDIWATSKVAPMSMVKHVKKDSSTMLLVSTTSKAVEHITGTPQKFDPQAFMQQRMQKKNQ
jgi:hypothetical protein